MSLLLKFGVLLGVLAAAIVAAMGAAALTLRYSQEEARPPLVSMSRALSVLGTLEETLEAQRGLLTAEPRPADLPGAVAGLSARAGALLRDLRAEEWAATVAGQTTLSNLAARLEALQAVLGHAAGGSAGADGALEALDAQLLPINELIERARRRIIADTEAALRYGEGVGERMQYLLASVLVAALLTCGLAYTLLRRWVVKPIARLRTAAARIAAGDFEHRIDAGPGGPRRDELSALSGEVNQMAGMVKSLLDERVDRERLAAIGEMVRRLTHNLRTPLAGIRALAEVSRMDLRDSGRAASAEAAENQTQIIATVDRFERWLSELLLSTRSPRVTPEEAPTREWLDETVKTYLGAARAANVRVEVVQERAPERARFDPRQLEQAMGVLIANALDAVAEENARHGDEPTPGSTAGTVRITSRVVAAPASPGLVSTWEIRVEDTGPGLRAEDVHRVFQPHYTTKPRGNGIGLAIALQIVRAHGGVIEVEESDVARPARGRTVVGVTAGSPGNGQLAASAVRDRGAAFVIRLPQ